MKKSIGTKFLEEFINLREKCPHIVTANIESFLAKHDVSVDQINGEQFQLISDFFGMDSYHILHINPKVKSKTVLIGKGICYDSGGYNIKADSKSMHYDKNGALLAIAAAIDNHVPALVFLTNNMIDTNAVVSGQILTDSISNTNVLIENTDAEGRIGLANLISYVQKHTNYKNIITMATLTGAACQVVGERTYAVIHSNIKKDYAYFIDQVIKGAANWWPGSFHIDYDNAIKTKVKGASISNCPSYRGAGSSTAFSFLKHFTNKHLTHLDIAPVMLDKEGNGLLFGLKEVKNLLNFLTK